MPEIAATAPVSTVLKLRWELKKIYWRYFRKYDGWLRKILGIKWMSWQTFQNDYSEPSIWSERYIRWLEIENSKRKWRLLDKERKAYYKAMFKGNLL